MSESHPSAQTNTSTKPETTIWIGLAWGIFLGGTAVLVLCWLAIWLSPAAVNAGNKSIGVASFVASLIVLSALVYVFLPKVRLQPASATPPPKTGVADRWTENWSYTVFQTGLTILGGFGAVFLVYTFYKAVNVGPRITGIGSGAFGDAFGAATSVFTALAFLGLLLTSRIQRKELKTAQDSFNELQIQTKQVLKTQRIQTLEDRFFKLHEVIENRHRQNDLINHLAKTVADQIRRIAQTSISVDNRTSPPFEAFSIELAYIRERSPYPNYLTELCIHEIVAADIAAREAGLEHLLPLLSGYINADIAFILVVHANTNRGHNRFPDGYDSFTAVSPQFIWALELEDREILREMSAPSPAGTYDV